MLHYKKSIAQQLNFITLQNGTYQQDNIYTDGSVSDADTVNSEVCVELSKMAVHTSLLFIILYLQM